MPHPDDPEYGTAAAVAKWTAAGRIVRYALASRGEAGIAGLAPAVAGPVRETEQRRAAAIVGVHDLQFWDFPDSEIRNTAALRARIVAAITDTEPDVLVTIYGGAQFGPDAPNQRDHIEFAAAVTEAYDGLAAPPRWLFQSGGPATHVEAVDGYADAAVAALAAHQTYFAVLDPGTAVEDQARRIVDMTTPAGPGGRLSGFICERRAFR
ncbi:PIG-L family deacetylase [Mycobacterium sp. M1]|uniref:PIG-L family deacetylase n=1 Tax=Mycolicibacter acidiphilus TaxID=2835306 RepID=A0ABS5RI40_9MYCO|nr:PIG-L family deacetylase [Mycolicibacter acidiphilus]MBS9533682.1 PIG-L family deacetylase [Mycolicibacter acidiphilus]